MTQATRVYTIDASAARTLEAQLREQLPPETVWRVVPHARFSLQMPGIALTCYDSGKLVLQGRDAETFAARFLADLDQTDRERPAPLVGSGALIGSDETGKGDYFGPLVVAATYVGVDDAKWLRALGVTDSKRLTDERMQRMVGALERGLDHEVVVLEPERYNERYRQTPNLNRLLAELHAEALAPLIVRHPTAAVLVDRFAANDALLQKAVNERVPGAPRIEQRPRAEEELAVAAASIIARVGFLEGLQACAEQCGSDLAKGAGRPVDLAAERVFRIGGMALLARVAKMHFRNTSKIRGSS